MKVPVSLRKGVRPSGLNKELQLLEWHLGGSWLFPRLGCARLSQGLRALLSAEAVNDFETSTVDLFEYCVTSQHDLLDQIETGALEIGVDLQVALGTIVARGTSWRPVFFAGGLIQAAPAIPEPARGPCSPDHAPSTLNRQFNRWRGRRSYVSTHLRAMS